MLLPSSIQRAEDLVGIAMPMVGLLWASASGAAAARPASANAINETFNLNMRHSLGFFELGTVVLDSVNRRLSLVGHRSTAMSDRRQCRHEPKSRNVAQARQQRHAHSARSTISILQCRDQPQVMR